MLAAPKACIYHILESISTVHFDFPMMLPITLMAMIGLLTTSVEGAPTQDTEQQQQQADTHDSYFHDGFNHLHLHKDVIRHGLVRRGALASNGTKIVKSERPSNGTSSALAAGQAAAAAAQSNDDKATSDCGLVATTTIDVTVYLTPSAQSDDDDNGPSRRTTARTSAPTTRSAASSAGSRSREAGESSARPAARSTTATTRGPRTAAALFVDPTPVSSRRRATTVTLRSKSSGASSTQSRRSTLTKPVAEESSAAAAAASASETCEDEEIIIQSTAFTTTVRRSAGAPRPTAAVGNKAPLVIDVSMTPVATAPLAATPTRPSRPTATVSEEDEETGAPEEDRTYCGVHGEPAGTYFIAEFIEDRPGVPVSLEGCYEFCDNVMDTTEGCQAYRFYYSEFGAPRCALYGMPVPWIVRDLDNDEPDRWFDLDCGSPTEERWTSGDA
ncbi:hypothetical protein HJFPF1_00804 [Paramyrothecium foliicola]|nr:hypothetical protein HJFPF1_00804 [Paramyrothecium foliicola]